MAKDGMHYVRKYGKCNYTLKTMVKGKIIKADIFVSHVGLALPDPGSLLSQQVTVERGTGHVTTWYNYQPEWNIDFTLEQSEQAEKDSIKESEFDISPDKAEHIFTLLKKFFSKRHEFAEIMDIGDWSITLTTDTGDEVEYSGIVGFKVDGLDMADVLREDLGLPDFHFFHALED